MCLIGAQHSKCLGASFHLELAGLLTLLPLGIGAGALLLQHHEESFVLGERGLGVVKVLLGLGELLIGVCELLSLGLRLLLPGNNLVLTGLFFAASSSKVKD